MTDLRKKTQKAVLWNIVQKFGNQFIKLFITVILARILLPAEFGLIASIVIVIFLAQALIDGGFGSALIQKKDVTKIDESTVFFLNTAIAMLIYLCLYLSSNWISNFYENPELISIIKIYSLIVIFNSFSVVPFNLLVKKLNFKPITYANFISNIFSGIIGVSFALSGFGVWALVIMDTSSSLVRVISILFLSKWKPQLKFSTKAARLMFDFGSKMLLTKLISSIFDNIYSVIIAKIYSLSDLGYYAKAKSLNKMTDDSTSNTAATILFPVFSEIQNDILRLKNGLRKSLKFIAFITMPMSIFLMAIADNLVIVLLSNTWYSTVDYFRILLLTSLIVPLRVVNNQLLIAKGFSNIILKIQLFSKILLVLVIYLFYNYGIKTLLIANFLFAIIPYILMLSYYSNKVIFYPISDQIKDIFPSLIISICISVPIFLFGQNLELNKKLELTIQIVLAILCYGVISYKFQNQSYNQFIKFLQIKQFTKKT